MDETLNLYLASKIKSELILILMQLEDQNGSSKEELVTEFKTIINEMMSLEQNLIANFNT